jgi:hypothetical protein
MGQKVIEVDKVVQVLKDRQVIHLKVQLVIQVTHQQVQGGQQELLLVDHKVFVVQVVRQVQLVLITQGQVVQQGQ